MRSTSSLRSQSPVAGISTSVPRRRTRNSVVSGELAPPYETSLGTGLLDGLVHQLGMVIGTDVWDMCCRTYYSATGVIVDPRGVPTCLACASCRGCHTCRPGHINEATMRKGKWRSSDDRTLYPFEMDSTHLMNAIKKLIREGARFKKDAAEWLAVLQTEAQQRGLL